jgi:hypothetical protein
MRCAFGSSAFVLCGMFACLPVTRAAEPIPLGYCLVQADPNPDREDDPEEADPDPYYLRRNGKLQVQVRLVKDHPALSEILTLLRESTGLILEVDEGLHNHAPRFGSVQYPQTQAFTLMEMVAKRDLTDGRWIDIPGGYRLVGTTTHTSSDLLGQGSGPGVRGIYLWLSLATLIVLLFISGWVLLRQPRRPKAQATSPSNP